MTKQLLILLLLVFGGIPFTSFAATAPALDLSDALAQKKITIEASSTGRFSGKCILLKIKNQGIRTLNLEVKAGTLFIPDEDKEQSILVVQPQLLVIGKLASQTFEIAGYCTEMKDLCPGNNSKFKMTTNKNPKLDGFTTLIAPMKKLGDDILQQAVWCITDSNSVSNVYNDDLTATRSIRNYLCSATGQADTWYNTKRIAEVDLNQNIINKAVEVGGKIKLNNNRPTELTGVIKNESGGIAFEYPNNMTLPKGRIEFEFNLKVKGWEKGNYYLVYTCEGKEIVNQKFTL